MTPITEIPHATEAGDGDVGGAQGGRDGRNRPATPGVAGPSGVGVRPVITSRFFVERSPGGILVAHAERFHDGRSAVAMTQGFREWPDAACVERLARLGGVTVADVWRAFVDAALAPGAGEA